MRTRPGFRSYFGVLACAVIVVMGWSSSVLAECEVAKLLASDGVADDYFGISIGISGDTAIVGADRIRMGF